MAHRPSVPGDLDHPRRLWARAATLGLLATAGFDGDAYQLRAGGLRCDGAGGTHWWRLTRHPGGRTVFRGQDVDGSHGHLRRVPVDFLAGGPDWLPWPELRSEQEGCALGYVYWWQDGGWGRAPYPDDLVDDGLEPAAGWVGDDGRLVDQLGEAAGRGPDLSAAVFAFLDRAEGRTVDERAVTTLLGACTAPERPDPAMVAVALDFAARAALTSAGDAPGNG
ncbi:hypothetical protein [Streptomyces radicis]|uniref:Uncharacterized protein n=1 Tax=Streptomyces radicis TaxID=1750517 RepID=A0A3A9W8D8_9ACTN|nr:hypothetical protein [Streptomyces radicis]RKN08613.1 hypothetical protein D7319_14550 [Streptomyces radicis]RKN21771.1 hypothetical protein D7318_15505 [Streptomyces radicis]